VSRPLKHSKLLALSLWVTLFTATLHAEDVFLFVNVRDVADRPLEDVGIGARGKGSMESTDRNGKARIRLAPGSKPGSMVTLQLRKGATETDPEWVFIDPWDDRVRLPPTTGTESFVAIVLGRRSDRELLEKGEALKAIVAGISQELTGRKGKGEEITEAALGEVLAAQAEKFGLLSEEIDRAIRAWSERATDPFEKGMGALYEQNYPEAGKELEASLELREGKLEKAQGEVLAATDEVVEAARFLGEARYLEGRYREAVEAYRKAVELRPDDGYLQNQLGIALLKNGDFDEAERIFRSELQEDIRRQGPEHPDTLTARNNLAQTLKAQGDLSAARQLQEQVLEARERTLGTDHPDTFSARLNLEQTLNAQGDLSAARQLEEQVLEARERTLGTDHPATFAAAWNLLQTVLEQEDTEAAGSLLFRLCRLANLDENRLGADQKYIRAQIIGSCPRVWFNRALKLAIELYRKAQPQRLADPILHNNLGAALRDHGQLDEAVVTLRRAIELDPEMARPHYHLGETLRRQGKLAEAIAVLRQAVELNPDELDAWTSLASAYEAEGQSAEAAEAMERAEALQRRQEDDE
jgi:Flp pilus assembly protein TadD